MTQARRRSMIGLSIVLLVAQLADLAWPRDDERTASPASLVFAYALLFLLALYPTGRFVPRWSPAAAALGSAMFIANAVAGPEQSARWFWPLPMAPVLLTLLILGQGYRYLRRASPIEREAVRWPLLGTLLALTLVVPADLIGVATTGTNLDPGPAGGVATSIVFLLPGIGFLLGVTVRRGGIVDHLIAGYLAVVAGAAVLAGVFVAVWLLLRLAAPPPVAVGGGVAAVAVACVAVIPLARRLAARAVYRGRISPAAAVRTLTTRLARSLDPLEIPHEVVDQLRGDVGAQQVLLRRYGTAAIWARAAAGGENEDAAGRPPIPSAEEFTVHYLGLPVATLAVWPRAGESSLTSADRRLIQAMAACAAPALHGARLASAFPELTDRERQVLAGISRGLPNTAIAAQLGVSGKTVANYVSLVLTKLRVPDRERAAELARRRAAEAGSG